MNKFIFLSILIFHSLNSVAQYYQPGLSSISLSNAPFTSVGQTGTATFSITNSGSCPLNRWNSTETTNKVIIRICLTEVFMTPSPSSTAALSGSGVSFFDWTYLSGDNCFQGIQTADIPGQGGGGIINVSYTYALGSTQSSGPFGSGSNGIVVNLFPPGYSNGAIQPASITNCSQAVSGGNNTVDDQSQAYTFLPIKLQNFNAKAFNQNVLLDWKSEIETNFSHFEIESSATGFNYIQIGKVEGNSAEKSYTFNDRQPHIDINYYRLKMVDLDGTFVYSDVKAVEMLSTRSGDVDVFPNPFTGGFTVRGLDKDATVQIYDSRGSLIFDQKSNDRLLRVDLPNLPSGLYNAVINSGGKTTSKNIIKVD